MSNDTIELNFKADTFEEVISQAISTFQPAAWGANIMLNKTDRQVDRGRRWDTRLTVSIQSGNPENLTAPQRRFETGRARIDAAH